MTEEVLQNKLRVHVGDEINARMNQYILTKSSTGFQWLLKLGSFPSKSNNKETIFDHSFNPPEKYRGFAATLLLRQHQFHLATNILKNIRSEQGTYHLACYHWIQSQPVGVEKTTLFILLRKTLCKKNADNDLDNFSLYLYGGLLHLARQLNEARVVLLKCVTIDPMNILAWIELDLLICDRETYMSLTLPDHWMSMFFEAHIRKKIWDFSISVKIYKKLYLLFNDSDYLKWEIYKLEHFLLDCLNYFDPNRTGYLDLKTLIPKDSLIVETYTKQHNLHMTLLSYCLNSV